MFREETMRICGLTANGEGHHGGDPDCVCGDIERLIESEVARLQDLADTRLRIFEAAATEQKRLREENEKLRHHVSNAEARMNHAEIKNSDLETERDRYRDALERDKQDLGSLMQMDPVTSRQAVKVACAVLRRIEEVLRDG